MKVITAICACVLLTVFFPKSYAEEPEIVAIIGTGGIGDSLGPLFAKHGHRIVYGSRKPASEKGTSLLTRSGNGASGCYSGPCGRRADRVVVAPVRVR